MVSIVYRELSTYMQKKMNKLLKINYALYSDLQLHPEFQQMNQNPSSWGHHLYYSLPDATCKYQPAMNEQQLMK